MNTTPWYCYPFLLFPQTIMRNLEERVQLGLVEDAPNAWQLSLGVMRMWHRSIFRSETVGTCAEGKPRNTWRARLLQNRALRLPCLLLEGAVAPLDLTGLASPKDRIIRHLLGAHHDGNQFVFDFELLAAHPGALEELRDKTRALLASDDAESRWLRDLAVYAHYHENLLAAVELVLERGIELSAEDRQDADISLAGYLHWCAQQPTTPADTLAALRDGTLRFSPRAATGLQTEQERRVASSSRRDDDVGWNPLGRATPRSDNEVVAVRRKSTLWRPMQTGRRSQSRGQA